MGGVRGFAKSLGDRAGRGIDAADLVRRVRNDLDWIVARAMAPERDRRYGSVGELAADVERHLRDEPVEARARSRASDVPAMPRTRAAGRSPSVSGATAHEDRMLR